MDSTIRTKETNFGMTITQNRSNYMAFIHENGEQSHFIHKVTELKNGKWTNQEYEGEKYKEKTITICTKKGNIDITLYKD